LTVSLKTLSFLLDAHRSSVRRWLREGGIIHVPAMVGLLGFPVHVATATSHFVLAFMALAGTAEPAALAAAKTKEFYAGPGGQAAAVVGEMKCLALGAAAGHPLAARSAADLESITVDEMLAL